MKIQKQYIVFFIIGFISLLSFKSIYNHKKVVEKIYTQTDRSFYFPGETIWFKSYIVHTNNTISNINDIVNAELISPKGAVVDNIKLAITQGYAYGDFYINKDWVGGIYTLKVYTNWMRNFGDEACFTKKITIQKVVKPNLLLDLKFEKEGYGKSSTVIGNFEVKDLKNNPLKNKKVQFEVAVKGNKILSQSIVTDLEGKANPTFVLPADLKSTDVVVNILIPYNGSTESISRSVPVVLDNVDLQFFPESGKIIANGINKVAFKALNEFGKPVDVSGDIFDSRNKHIANFNSFHDGMGAFNFKPKKGESYYANIKEPFVSSRKIALPDVHEKGVQFSITTDSLQTKLQLFSNQKETLFLKVSNASKKLLKKEIKSTNKELIIDTKNFPIGITKFSILDTTQHIVAERIVFINAHKKLNIAINLDKLRYETREKVKVSIKTTDYNHQPVPSNLSVAIADNKLVSFANDKQDHILSSLLVTSELKGEIYKPSFYVNPKEPKSHKALDYVMLTHGWRDYINNPTTTIENATFKPAQNSIHSGIILDKKGNPVEANILVFDHWGNKVMVLKSNKKGVFFFKSLTGKRLAIVAYTDDGRKLKIVKNKLKGGNYSEISRGKNKVNKDKVKEFFKNEKPAIKNIKEKAMANIALTEDASQLDEIVVVGYGTVKKSHLTGAITKIRSEEFTTKTTVAQALQGRVAGVKIKENSSPGNAPKITIRGVGSISGDSEPLIVVDGVPSDSSVLGELDMNTVGSFNILKDVAATSLYGSSASNGVILITTKNGKYYNNWSKKRLNNKKFNNYIVEIFYSNRASNVYKPRSFYVPKYDSKILPEERTDFRQTIYWNPVVQTDENGEASFEFYNSDAVTSFKITLEGIGFNGLVGRKEKEYATTKMINLDFKAPNYMALNDTISLPVTIINESEKVIKGELSISLPKNLKLLESFDANIKLEGKSSLLKNIKVVPVEKGKNVRIKVGLKGEGFSDIVKRKATILSPYFPTETAMSGSKSQNFSVNINNVVKNSIKAEFNIYTDIVGDVMSGIEGLIRKPYGCFEQTSSSTYPNIMVLKYLRESGKSNPAIEEKALNFIKKGYKRLISFETSKGGFEWFGHTPPHETLTAYGILEFTEMKEVYPKVNQRMIDRTVKWLLSRRDGKGGFNKSKKGYDSFASSPIDVANAYIVYALSEAGVNADFNLEYETAYKDAIQSNDTYKMALIALASYNLGEEAKATTLINKIKANIEMYNFQGLPVANTITRSYGNAKNIETTAFTVLALLRDKTNNDFIITKGIEYLVSKRRYNTFGSTQSTAMALKALIAYTKKQKQLIVTQNGAIEVSVNGKKFKEELRIDKTGKITIDGLSEHIKEGKQNIDVHYTNSEMTFPYSLNITWDSFLPNSAQNCALGLKTDITNKNYKVGDNISMAIKVSNKRSEKLGMATAIIGIPSGTTAQPWQLKEVLEKNKVAYYEVFDNYLVFYWREFDALETKNIRLDLKADIAGSYKAPASTVYLYYGDEFKTWISGTTVKIFE